MWGARRTCAATGALVLLASHVATAFGLVVAVTPVQKVVEMLSGMSAQGKKEQQTEKQTFEEYSKWVKSRTQELGFEIKMSQDRIEELTASIEKWDNEVAQLGEAIAGLDSDVARLEGDKKAAAEVRARERADFEKLQKDYSESIDALERAISTVAAQNYDRPQAQLLLQTMAQHARGLQQVLAAMEEESSGLGAPAADAYASQTSGIQTMLEGLLKKFKGELAEVQTAESNKAHYFNLGDLHLGDSIKQSAADREEKVAVKGSIAAASAKAKGDLADTTKELKEEQRFLSDIQSTFKAKSATFTANQKLREEELKAIGKAIEIISSPEVAGSYSEHINLVQAPARAVSLLQVARSRRRASASERAAEFLAKRAGSLSSSVLAAVAEQLTSNPFSKVIGLVEGLLAKLKEDAAAEADHKGWCDEQLKSNKLKREKQATQVDRLNAAIEQATANIASMAKRIQTLVKDQSDLIQAMKEAAAQREKEKAANSETIADAQAGADAVKRALVVLKQFYGQQQVALLQQRQAPELAAYGGLTGQSGGVIGMLEVIVSDFQRLEAETKATEARAANEFASFTKDSEVDKETKHKAEVKLRLQKDQTEFDRSQLQKDLASNQDELQKANDYFEQLKTSCLEVKVSYEERVAKRKEEIAALKEAYDVLNGKSSD